MKLATITSFSLLIATGSAHAIDWSINTLSASYGTNYQHPNNPNEYDAKIIGFVHVSGDKLGRNVVQLFVTNSDDNDKGNPANPQSSPSIETRAEIRREFSLGKMTGNKDGYGPFKDLFLSGEYNVGMKETPALGHSNSFRLGVGADLPLSAGAASITLFVDKAYNAFNIRPAAGPTGGKYTTEWTPGVRLGWNIPVGNVAEFAGFLDYVAKGRGRTSLGTTMQAETQLNARLLVPVGDKRNGLKIGAGYQYWENIKGGVGTTGNTRKSPRLILEYVL